MQIASYKSSHRDVKQSTGNIVKNIVIMYDVRWVPDLLGDHFVSYINV